MRAATARADVYVTFTGVRSGRRRIRRLNERALGFRLPLASAIALVGDQAVELVVERLDLPVSAVAQRAVRAPARPRPWPNPCGPGRLSSARASSRVAMSCFSLIGPPQRRKKDRLFGSLLCGGLLNGQLSFGTLPWPRDTARAMSDENVALARKAIDALNRGDSDGLLAFLSPDVVWEALEGVRGCDLYRGRAGVRGGS